MSNKDKVSRRTSLRLLGAAIPTVISIYALYQSNTANKIAEYSLKRDLYNDATNFNVIQNLWQDNPEFILFNESTKKLSEPPAVGYIVVVPSKIFWPSDLSRGRSTSIFSPVPYSEILEQVNSGKTIDAIETSRLPSYFKSKLGARDSFCSEGVLGTEGELEGSGFKIETYPFLVVIAEVVYSYVGEEELRVSRILSTPLGKHAITEDNLNNIKRYISDNSFLESSYIEGDESIYKSIHKNVVKNFKDIDNTLSILGGNGYGGVLKDFNSLITPVDPIAGVDSSNSCWSGSNILNLE